MEMLCLQEITAALWLKHSKYMLNVPIATPTLPAITTAITKENATAEYVKLRTDIQSL